MLSRKELTSRISRCVREDSTLRETNDRGQNNDRIARLAQVRIEAVRKLNQLKIGR